MSASTMHAVLYNSYIYLANIVYCCLHTKVACILDSCIWELVKAVFWLSAGDRVINQPKSWGVSSIQAVSGFQRHKLTLRVFQAFQIL